MNYLKTLFFIVIISLIFTSCSKGGFNSFLTSHLFKDNYGDEKCIKGNCKNGQGTLEATDGKYYRIHKGEFRDDRLWNGTITGKLPEGKMRLIYVIKDGKVVVNAK